MPGNSLNLESMLLKVSGRVGQQPGRTPCADDGVRADENAFAALDAQVGFPDRDLERDVALFPLGGAGREGAVDGHGADGQVVAFEGDHGPSTSFTNSGAASGTGARIADCAR
jgi:hypothetical protein